MSDIMDMRGETEERVDDPALDLILQRRLEVRRAELRLRAPPVQAMVSVRPEAVRESAPMPDQAFLARATAVFGAFPTTGREADRRALAVREEAGTRQERLATVAAARRIPLDDRTMAVARMPEAEVQGFAMTDLRDALARRRARGGRLGFLKFYVGNVDTGKTCAGARAVLWHDQPALYVLASDLPDASGDLTAIAFALQEAVTQQRQLLRRVDLLVIDEVGTEAHPERVMAWACLRYGMGLASVLLGNANLDNTNRYAEERFESRLLDRQDKAVVGDPVIHITDRAMSKRSLPSGGGRKDGSPEGRKDGRTT